MIAQNKVGGKSLQVRDMENFYAKGKLERHEAAGNKNAAHWSTHDMKVADFQEAHPS